MNIQNDSAVEAMAKAHCDFFGGEGWWDTGLIADTKPKALEAMRAALDAMPSDTALREQRDDLLEACKALDAMWSRDWEPPHLDRAQQEPHIISSECLDVWRNIRAAIAKVRAS